ncbi:MAG: prolyl oligopeptidase family serine peptidase [Rhizobacter sp.]|nr:prolyl oligopeptidase family serine peptidase [Burkholderiales bacterium]
MSFKSRSAHISMALTATALGTALLNSAAVAVDAARYKTPPAPLQAVVEQLSAPSLTLSPRRDLAAMVKTPTLPSIREVAQPELKLAGLRINPRTYSQSRFSFGEDLWLFDIATRKEIRLTGLPQNLRLADMAWSPDQSALAFTHVADASVELWVVDVAAKSARKISSSPLHSVYGRGFSWMPDSRSLLVRLRPAGQGVAPVATTVPVGPNSQDAIPSGSARQVVTLQDLLKNENDAAVFDHYTLIQAAHIELNGKTTMIGKPDRFLAISVAPDGKHVLTQAIERPYSYAVSSRSFPRRIEVRNLSGAVTHTVAKLALEEGLPPGNDAVRTGVRDISWRADQPATLVWAEAQDGGDPAKAVPFRDLVLTQAAPFTDQPRELIKLATRYQGVLWARGDLAIISEYWWKTRAVKRWRIAPDAAATPAELLASFSSEDRYNDPGMPKTRVDESGHTRLLVAADGESIFLDGVGASPEGDRPFVDRLNLVSKDKGRLFRSETPVFENVMELLDNEGKRILTTRESPTEPSNFYVRDLTQPKASQLTQLTQFSHPTPQLINVTKEQIRYQRADGVDLTATLFLPPNYDAKRDGPLPMLMWAYPQEFTSASAASQVTGSPFRFNSISYWRPQALLSMGYAVLDNPSMPIVGEGGKEANDSYLPQLIANAEAAINEVVRRGVADRDRIAIGGHSYGAFMTANLLAHTRLFRAGIARSGAYNRTLTPFGFQSEERNFWTAQSTYHAMSPFNYADKIKDAILLIHGEQDNNPGTYPVQSERLFQAIKGLGGTARLVMLPNESHAYRARESISHMLYETNLWMEQYVKNAKPRADVANPKVAAPR